MSTISVVHIGASDCTGGGRRVETGRVDEDEAGSVSDGSGGCGCGGDGAGIGA